MKWSGIDNSDLGSVSLYMTCFSTTLSEKNCNEAELPFTQETISVAKWQLNADFFCNNLVELNTLTVQFFEGAWFITGSNYLPDTYLK